MNITFWILHIIAVLAGVSSALFITVPLHMILGAITSNKDKG